jgi:hypothetical protein
MGMLIDRLIYLQTQGHLSAGKSKIIDIGPQNVYHLTREKIRAFLDRQGTVISGRALESEIDRLIYFSTPRPNERTTMLSEITDLTPIEYNSFDVCPGLKTDILDLNYDALPEKYLEYYDIALNFGTTEHIFNQFNAFKVIHDAIKPGGVIYCDLPATGYLDHGYYCYTPLFFRELAEANEYELLDLFYLEAGLVRLDDLKVDVRTNETYMSAGSGALDEPKKTIVNFNCHAVFRKTVSAPFRCKLEVATSHGSIDRSIMQHYGADADAGYDSASSSPRKLSEALVELREARRQVAGLRNSISWRITAPARALARMLGRR